MMKIFDDLDVCDKEKLSMTEFVKGCEKDPTIHNLLQPMKGKRAVSDV